MNAITNFWVARYFWQCDTALKVPLKEKFVRGLDHLFLSRWRYRRHIALATPNPNQAVEEPK